MIILPGELQDIVCTFGKWPGWEVCNTLKLQYSNCVLEPQGSVNDIGVAPIIRFLEKYGDGTEGRGKEKREGERTSCFPLLGFIIVMMRNNAKPL